MTSIFLWENSVVTVFKFLCTKNIFILDSKMYIYIYIFILKKMRFKKDIHERLKTTTTTTKKQLTN